MKESHFKQQAALLLEIISDVVSDDEIALKGGTAINLFMQNLPRLSVDIDLAYIKISDRDSFIRRISEIAAEICRKLNRRPFLKVFPNRTADGLTSQIRVESPEASIKIDINFVMRGSVYESYYVNSCALVENIFKKSVKVKCLSFEDLYAGKFCAALDRGHPRDMFDLFIFFKTNQITEKLKIAFIAYLLSSNRPISELLDPAPNKNLKILFEKEFDGMTTEPITLIDLEDARKLLVDSLNGALTDDDKKFLVSFKSGEPIWQLFPIDHLKEMPSIKWKLHNIKNMPQAKHAAALEKLKQILA